MLKIFKSKRRKGVTLVEIIIVIVIIAVLTGIGFWAGASAQESGKQSVALTDLRTFGTMATQMLYEHPQLMTASSITTADGEKILNKYLGEESTFSNGESEKTDAWGNPYEVMFSTADRESGKQEFYVTIYSAGKNGEITTTSLDNDDCGIVVALSDGAVITEMFGFKDSEYDHSSHDLSKIIVNKGTYAS